jgi:hypothetical protein
LRPRITRMGANNWEGRLSSRPGLMHHFKFGGSKAAAPSQMRWTSIAYPITFFDNSSNSITSIRTTKENEGHEGWGRGELMIAFGFNSLFVNFVLLVVDHV